VILFFAWRRRVPFSTAMLIEVTDMVKAYPATVGFGFLAMIIQNVWYLAFVFMFILVASNASSPTFVWVVLIFSFYWVSQVVMNWVHVVGAGTFATDYFSGRHNVKDPVYGAAKRASTTSFGSICLGSFLVALLRTIRTVVRSMADSCDSFVACFILCCLACIDNLISYFNQYAFAQVAIYGKSFVQAAKDTFALIHGHGIEAVINDCLIGPVLNLGIFMVAIFTAAAGVGLAFAVWRLSVLFLVFFGVVGLFIGAVVCAVVMEVVNSAVVTIFVCYAEDPAALGVHHADLARTFRETYNL